MKEWTTQDFFKTLLDFIALVPDSQEWNEEALNFNQPRLVRLRQVKALLRAFDITSDKAPSKYLLNLEDLDATWETTKIE